LSTIAHNKEIVRRYFGEALDARNVAVLDELFTPDCIIHRTESSTPLIGIEAIRNVVRIANERYVSMHSEIHDLIAEGDKVACHLTHTAVFRDRWKSRLGEHALAGREIRWSPVAIFAFRDGKASEEWVHRDELGMLLSAGVQLSFK
jgi:predicted ester cyclase